MSSAENPPPPEQPGSGRGEVAYGAPPAVTGPVESPPWTLSDVLRLVLIALLAIAFFSVVAMGIAVSRAGREAAEALTHDPKVVVPAQLAAYLVVVAYMSAIVRGRGAPFWRGIRWNFPNAGWAAYLFIGGALAIAVQAASAWLPIPKSLPIEHYFRDPAGAWLMTAFGVSLAPLVEELFFRGFLYPALARRLGVAAGVALTALPFALIHASQLARAWAPLLLLFIVGLVLTAVRARTRSVGASFLVHVGYNATLFALLYAGTDGFTNFEKLA